MLVNKWTIGYMVIRVFFTALILAFCFWVGYFASYLLNMKKLKDKIDNIQLSVNTKNIKNSKI